MAAKPAYAVALCERTVPYQDSTAVGIAEVLKWVRHVEPHNTGQDMVALLAPYLKIPVPPPPPSYRAVRPGEEPIMRCTRRWYLSTGWGQCRMTANIEYVIFSEMCHHHQNFRY